MFKSTTESHIRNFYKEYIVLLERYLKANNFAIDIMTFETLDELVDFLRGIKDEYCLCETFIKEVIPVLKESLGASSKSFEQAESIYNILEYNRYLLNQAFNKKEWNEFASFMIDVPFRVYEELNNTH